MTAYRSTSPLFVSGETRFGLGHRLVDRYLAFVAGRARPNTVRAAAFDLNAFFTIVGKGPLEVTAADVLDFVAAQRGDRTVVRLADRKSGLSPRTIARRLASVSGFYDVCRSSGRHADDREPGAAGPIHAPAGSVEEGADGATGAGARDADEDPVVDWPNATV